MFCPQCGTSQGDELKFCKSCGANLYAVKQAVTSREGPEKVGWGQAWVTQMRVIQDEQEKRKRERERPEEKRYNEIKAGVITSCIGVGVMIFLYVLMQGIILSGQNPPRDAEILSRIWIAGVIPLFIGLGLLINGVFVSKKLVELRQRELQGPEAAKTLAAARDSLDDFSPASAARYESDSPKPSVTEHTTRQLENSSRTK